MRQKAKPHPDSFGHDSELAVPVLDFLVLILFQSHVTHILSSDRFPSITFLRMIHQEETPGPKEFSKL
jgi:hypothetical protein